MLIIRIISHLVVGRQPFCFFLTIQTDPFAMLYLLFPEPKIIRSIVTSIHKKPPKILKVSISYNKGIRLSSVFLNFFAGKLLEILNWFFGCCYITPD